MLIEPQDLVSSSYGDFILQYQCDESGNNYHVRGPRHSCSFPLAWSKNFTWTYFHPPTPRGDCLSFLLAVADFKVPRGHC